MRKNEGKQKLLRHRYTIKDSVPKKSGGASLASPLKKVKAITENVTFAQMWKSPGQQVDQRLYTQLLTNTQVDVSFRSAIQ